MFYKGKIVNRKVLMALVINIVEETGFNISATDCNKFYNFGVYFWQKALSDLTNRGLLYKAYDRRWYNLEEENINERLWGFIEGYKLNKTNIKKDLFNRYL